MDDQDLADLAHDALYGDLSQDEFERLLRAAIDRRMVELVVGEICAADWIPPVFGPEDT